ncbi:MAG: diguanylate cyclase [Acidimicrobiales bacterium]|nr:diguanylate cyclase [Acidimicrobiales bacterium]
MDEAARPQVISDVAFRVIVDTLTLPVLVADGTGTVVYAGGSVEASFGYEPHEILGRNVIEFTPPEEVERALQSIEELTRADDLGIAVPTAFPIIRKDGTLTWMAIGAVPLFDTDVEGMTFYFLPWDAQLHFDEFFAALLAGDPLDVVFARLALSIAISMESLGVSIHHGFDGVHFESVDGAGHPLGIERIADAPWHEAARSGEPQYVRTVDVEAFAGHTAVEEAAGCWAIPLVPHRSIEPAVMTVWRAVDTPPVRAHDFVILRSLRYVQLALVRSAEHRQLSDLADHDHLTGLANRGLFQRTVQAELAAGSTDVALMYCDLDGFKAVNDHFGHGAGDEVLVEVARRLRRAAEGFGEVARIGGDEFTLFVRTDADSARAAARRLVEALDAPIEVLGRVVPLGLSVGLAIGPARSVDELMRRADAALYTAKRAGGSRVAEAPLVSN